METPRASRVELVTPGFCRVANSTLSRIWPVDVVGNRDSVRKGVADNTERKYVTIIRVMHTGEGSGAVSRRTRTSCSKLPQRRNKDLADAGAIADSRLGPLAFSTGWPALQSRIAGCPWRQPGSFGREENWFSPAGRGPPESLVALRS